MFDTCPNRDNPETSSTYLKGEERGVLIGREVLRCPLTCPGLSQEGKLLKVLRVKAGNHLLGGDTGEDNLESLTHPVHQTVPLLILPPLLFQQLAEHLEFTSSGRWNSVPCSGISYGPMNHRKVLLHAVAREWVL